MARLEKRLVENARGDFFVDATCIDCGTCRQVAPKTFAQGREASFVQSQPADEADIRRARMALIACPVAAIGTVQKHELREARESFPERLEGGVYYCGYAAESSFGARSYLIVRPQGNVLVDSPRFAAPLVKRLESLGGVRWMFLTHCDDVADHRKFRERFGCERVLHRADIGSGTRDVERVLEGEAPIRLDEDLQAIPVPGHTAGSVCLLYRERYLFTGDHAFWEPEHSRIVAYRSVCWFDWQAQTESMAKLQQRRFEWLLPGHGTRGQASAHRMAEELERCVARMRSRPTASG